MGEKKSRAVLLKIRKLIDELLGDGTPKENKKKEKKKKKKKKKR